MQQTGARDVPKETDLYPPIKTFLQSQGYEVKGEVGAADIVALRGDEPPLIVELKTGFSLALFHQGIARLAITDQVYLAVPAGGRRKALAANVALARRAGLGVMTVRARDGLVEVLADPGPYAARKSPKKTTQLLRAFARLDGDPNDGGATRHGIVTGYRQDAVKCARALAAGARPVADVRAETDVPQARQIMADNHYGWFERIARGVYALTDAGQRALSDYGDL